MILVNIRLLSELPIARELCRRLIERGEALTFCAEIDDGEVGERICRAATDLDAGYLNFAELVRAESASTATPKSGGRVSKVIAGWTRSAEDRALDESPRGRAFLAGLSSELAAARRAMAIAKPHLLVVFQDGVSANSPLIRAAIDAGVPILDCPYGSGSTRDFDDYLEEKAAENNLNFADGPFGERVKRDYPHWVRQAKPGEVLMFPAEYVLVRERLGLSLPLPWVIHGGLADVLAAESEMMRRHYLSDGIAAEKIRLTGTVYCDVMFDALAASPEAKAAYEGATKIQLGKTSVLLSLPPSLHGIRGQFSEFATYEDACHAIVDMIRRHPQVSASVSLHPNAPAEQRAFIDSLGLPVVDRWIISLIPAFDLFFTTFSSTIRWAIACGKPVLNYNMYTYNCPDYDGVDGVITHAKLQAIEARLDQLSDDGAYAACAAAQQKAGQEWGMLDGRNFERLYAVINKLRDRRIEARA